MTIRLKKKDILSFSDMKKRLRGKEWYRQRFDGSPMYLFAIAEAEVKKEKRKPAGTEAKVRVCFYKDGIADWYLDMKDVRRGAKVLTDLAKKEVNLSSKLLAAWEKDEEKFQRFFKSFESVDYKGLSDTELLVLFQKNRDSFFARVTSSAVIDHFALGTDIQVAKMLREEIGKINKESEFTEIFSVATAPVSQSFINEAEMELLEIAIEAPDDDRRLEEYQRKYYWSRNNYTTAQVLTVDDFKKDIDVWRESGADLIAKYEQLKETPRLNKEKKQQVFDKYHFSSLLRTMLKISEDFTWWQDERKKATYLNIHIGTSILNEMARRRGYDKESMKFMVAPEVKGMFSEDVPSQSALKKRQQSCGMVVWDGGYEILTGQAAEELRKYMFASKAKDQVDDVRGLTASVGRVTGKVKVIGSVKEIEKVEVGDILVAVMTRPDYIVGIKRAAAIVTDEGGITCHAAIVARELGLPCVIGTKIATQELKDGDEVEVNANHGVVTILRRVK